MASSIDPDSSADNGEDAFRLCLCGLKSTNPSQ
jgi:hypothetical protein